MKKTLFWFLLFAMILSIVPTALAINDDAVTAAQELYELGLFKGTGTDAEGKPIFDLERSPSRAEAVTMLVRLLGKESEALAGAWETRFTDVPSWAEKYVGYAYSAGLTKGTSENTFGGADIITSSQYLTFVLRALGYDSSTDFKWNAAWELSDQLGITDGKYSVESTFTRGDVAIISKNALSAALKGQSTTLADSLGLIAPSEQPQVISKTSGITQEDLQGIWYIVQHQSIGKVTQLTLSTSFQEILLCVPSSLPPLPAMALELIHLLKAMVVP